MSQSKDEMESRRKHETCQGPSTHNTHLPNLLYFLVKFPFHLLARRPHGANTLERPLQRTDKGRERGRKLAGTREGIVVLGLLVPLIPLVWKVNTTAIGVHTTPAHTLGSHGLFKHVHHLFTLRGRAQAVTPAAVGRVVLDEHGAVTEVI